MKAQFSLDFLNKEYLNFKIKFNIKFLIIFIALLKIKIKNYLYLMYEEYFKNLKSKFILSRKHTYKFYAYMR